MTKIRFNEHLLQTYCIISFMVYKIMKRAHFPEASFKLPGCKVLFRH